MTTKLAFIAGLGSTGSSAVCDFCEENEDVFAPKEEWRFWVDPDCVIDLIATIQGDSSIFTVSTALDRFNKALKSIAGKSWQAYSTLQLHPSHANLVDEIRHEILEALIAHTYHGLWYGNSNFFNAKLNFLERKFPISKRNWSWKKPYINKEMYLARHDAENLYEVLGQIIESKINNLARERNVENIIINENFSALFSNAIFSLHPNSKVLLVVRDPLDVYADSYRVGWLAMPYDIQMFIHWQWQMFNQVKTARKTYPDKFSIVSFEQLVNNYDTVSIRIIDFLGLDWSKHAVKTIFDPERSKKNIGQWRKTHSWLEAYRGQLPNFTELG